MMGQTQTMDMEKKQFDGIVYMPCNAENDFFPDLATLPRADVMYFCSPNNPTGAVASRAQLEALVAYAREKGTILVFDAAYAPFIRTPGVPKSIYEIEGAETCAIECNSFSKCAGFARARVGAVGDDTLSPPLSLSLFRYAGFTGVRLGWTVVPKGLKFADGSSVRDDFNRVMCTAFNGASNVVQPGGLACLDDAGLAEIESLIEYYLGNAAILRSAAEEMGVPHYGGVDSPYVYLDLGGKSSWDTFSDILEKCQIVTIPGAGFGPGGEGFLRLSAFAPRASCEEAKKRLIDAYGTSGF